MKKVKTICVLALLAITFVACDKNEVLENNPIMKAPQYDEKLAAEYNADFDRVAFAVNRLLERDEFRAIIHKEVGAMFDGDYNVLISQLVKNYGSVAEWFNKFELDVHSIVEKYPLIQIAIPVNYEKWEGNTSLPVVFMDYAFDDGESLFVQGYNSEGKSIKLDAVEEPEFPVVVISENERTSLLDKMPTNPAIPQNLTTTEDKEGIMLEWEQYSDENTVGYDIYRKGEFDEAFVQIASLISSKSDKNTYSFLDGNAVGGDYQYYVVGTGNHLTRGFIITRDDLFTLKKDIGILYSESSNIAFANGSSNGSIYISLQISYHTSKSLKLEWEADMGGYATYDIWRSSKSKFGNLTNFEKIATTASTSRSFIDSNLDRTCTYKYKLSAIYIGNGNTVWSNTKSSHASDRSNNQKMQIKECKFDSKADLRKVEHWLRGAPEMRVVCCVGGKNGWTKITPIRFDVNKSANIYDSWYTVNGLFLDKDEVNTKGSIVSFFWWEEDDISSNYNLIDESVSYENHSNSSFDIIETMFEDRMTYTYNGDDFITPACYIMSGNSVNGIGKYYYYYAGTCAGLQSPTFTWWCNGDVTYSEIGNVGFKWKIKTIN